MEIVECKTGNKFGLALGPMVLNTLASYYKRILPARVTKRLGELALNQDKEMEDISEAELLEMLTDEEYELVQNSEIEKELDAVRESLMTYNGEKIDDMDFFLKVTMKISEFQEVTAKIREAVKEYQDGLEVSGESEPSSSKQTRAPKTATAK